MNFTPETVELIVQRVLEHLGTPGRGAPAISLPQAAPAGKRIAEKVVTQSVLAESLNGSTTVCIGPRAILTPSALDFVRQRGIKIVRESAGPAPGDAARVQVLVSTSNPQVGPAVESLKQYGIALDLQISGTPAEAAAQGTGAVRRAETEKVVVFTDEPELVACLANRNEQIRAAAAHEAAALERMLRTFRPNVLAIDPRNRSVHELRTLLRTF